MTGHKLTTYAMVIVLVIAGSTWLGGDTAHAEYEVQSNDDRDVTSPFRLFRLGITKGQPKARGYYDRWAAKSN